MLKSTGRTESLSKDPVHLTWEDLEEAFFGRAGQNWFWSQKKNRISTYFRALLKEGYGLVTVHLNFFG